MNRKRIKTKSGDFKKICHQKLEDEAERRQKALDRYLAIYCNKEFIVGDDGTDEEEENEVSEVFVNEGNRLTVVEGPQVENN